MDRVLQEPALLLPIREKPHLGICFEPAHRLPNSMAPGNKGKAGDEDKNWLQKFQDKHMLFIPIEVRPRGRKTRGTPS